MTASIAAATFAATSREGLLAPPGPAALAALGITADDFAFFTQTFVGQEWTYSIRRARDGEWRVAPEFPLTTALLLKHLKGEVSIGTGARWSTAQEKFVARWFAVDLDHGDDLHSRYETVIGAIGRPSVVFGSEATGGLHSYYFLDREVALHQLRDAFGSNGMVIRLLRRVGAGEQRGIEVYPRGKYERRGIQNRLRLPFGRAWRLLDSDSLLPIVNPASPLEDLKRVRALFEHEKVELHDPAALYERSLGVWPSGRRARAAGGRQRADRTAIAERETYVADLKDRGLTGPNEFNAAVRALAYDGLWRGLSSSETVASIDAWLATGRHNGVSTTVNRSRQRARDEVAAVTAAIFKRQPPSRWCEMPWVSASEVEAMLAATSRQVAADPETGEALSLFKVQRTAFELLRRAKQYILTEVGGVIGWIHRARPELAAGDRDRHDATVLSRVRHVWPDSSRPLFIVACPYTLRLSLPLVSERTVGPYWRAIQGAGVFVRRGKANVLASRCETFEVRLDFGANGNAHFENFDNAVVALVEGTELRDLYGRHHERRLLQLQIPDIAPAPPVTTAETLVRRLVTASVAGHSAA